MRLGEALPLDTPLLGKVPLFKVACAICGKPIGYATRWSVNFFKAGCKNGCSL